MSSSYAIKPIVCECGFMFNPRSQLKRRDTAICPSCGRQVVKIPMGISGYGDRLFPKEEVEKYVF